MSKQHNEHEPDDFELPERDDRDEADDDLEELDLDDEDDDADGEDEFGDDDDEPGPGFDTICPNISANLSWFAK